MTEREIILSIKPEYWDLILAGEKSFEFRRRFVKHFHFGRIWFYVSAPVQRILGYSDCGWIYNSIDLIWRWCEIGSGLTDSKFQEYFTGCQNGFAIFISSLSPVNIDPKKEGWWKRPPQNFMYKRGDIE